MANDEVAPSVARLAEKATADRETRQKLISRISDVLVELGADADEVRAALPTEQLIEGVRPDPGGSTNVVIITRSDSDKNSTSIIIF